MRRNMKKGLGLILAAAMAVAMVGCGSNGGAGSSQEVQTEAGSTESTGEGTGAEGSNATTGGETGAAGVENGTEGTESAESGTEGIGTTEGTGAEGSNATTGDETEVAEAVYLRELFAEHGMKVGTCLTTRMINTAAISDLVTSQFSSVTMENDMKPDYIFDKKASKESGSLVIALNDNAIKMLDWAKANDMAVRGHTFVWYSQTPGWIFYEEFNQSKSLASREVMLDRMEQLISGMFSTLEEAGYLDLFYAYDVVNEAWMEDGQMRSENNLWYKTIGEDYIWYAFYYANKYAPEHVDLYYNDYNEQYKTETLVKFVETLKDEDGNYLIDGIGLQAHLYTGDSLDTYFRTVDRLAGLGLKIQLTELDVSLGAWQNTKPATDENLKTQGKYYYKLINGILERVDNGTLNSDALTFWGFSDGMSWRKEASPLLYDAKYQPKYAFYGAAQIQDKAGY